MQERAKRTGSKSEQTLKITKIEILTIEGFLKITSSRFSKILVDSIKHTSGLRRSIYWVFVQWSHVRAEIPCPLAVQDLSFFLQQTIARSSPANANYLQQWKLKNHIPLLATSRLVSSLWFIDFFFLSRHTCLYRSSIQSTDGGSIPCREQLAAWYMTCKRIFKKTPPYPLISALCPQTP